MDISEVVSNISQSCFRGSPVIVLGSGASAQYGLRGMGALADHLRKKVVATTDSEVDAWMMVQTALVNGDGLEEALLNNTVPQSLVSQIVRCTWQAIAEDDTKVLLEAGLGRVKFPLTALLEGLLHSSNRVVSIVTTNYDRVAEYAVDLAGVLHETGFLPGIIRSRQRVEIVPRSGNQVMRRVRIWKVHGSIDWFSDKNGKPVCLPVLPDLPEGLEPLIVTPGTSKYERTGEEPFRTIVQSADRAILDANSILCVGYGFRDKHIQPKMVELCTDKNVPIVVLAMKLTPEALLFLKTNGGRSWLALEKCGDNTKAYSQDFPDGKELDGEHWSLDGFNKLVLSGRL